MGRNKKEGVFTFVFRHVKGKLLLEAGHKIDDSGNEIIPHRLYAFESNRAFKKIYLNPKKHGR